MNDDFVTDAVEDEQRPVIIGCLSGWEGIVFVVEEEVDASHEPSSFFTAAIAP